MSADERAWLAERFEGHRDHLWRVAHRILGSASEADDAVQESWLRLSRSDTSDVANLRGWLTTVVARLCLDQLRARKSRSEEPIDVQHSEPIASSDAAHELEREEELADSLGLALLVVLETLPPSERVAFVLHDLFDVPFAEVAQIVGKSEPAARQLASRARRRVQGATAAPNADHARKRAIVDAFLAASRGGDFEALLALLDPTVVLRADAGAARLGAMVELHGAQEVAKTFVGRARGARSATIDGEAGAVWAPGGSPRVVFAFTIEGDRIVAIDLLADPDRLRELSIVTE